MFIWLASLPPLWQILLPVFFLLVVAFISIFGKFAWDTKFGKFGIGGIKKVNKRSCSDCLCLAFNKREKLEKDISSISNGILKDQMNFSEQKMIESLNGLSLSYRKELKDKNTSSADSHKEYLLYREALQNGFELGKNELRRSFKENGFEELAGIEFTSYVKSKTLTLISLIQEYLTSHYPYAGMAISLNDRFDKLDKSKIEDTVFEIFVYAKDIHKKARLEIEKINKEFISDIDLLLRGQ